jgi:hypothetical protein
MEGPAQAGRSTASRLGQDGGRPRGANALFGFWWADPIIALGMTVFIGREALEAWCGDDDG